MSANDTNSVTGLLEVIKIDDITSGKVDAQVVYAELERLKIEINVLRKDMTLFIKALANIPSDHSQQDYYQMVSFRLKTIQQSIKEYCEQYEKILPIINLAQIRLGHEVEILQNRKPSSVTNGSKIVPTASLMPNGSPKRRSSVKQNGSVR